MLTLLVSEKGRHKENTPASGVLAPTQRQDELAQHARKGYPPGDERDVQPPDAITVRNVSPVTWANIKVAIVYIPSGNTSPQYWGS